MLSAGTDLRQLLAALALLAELNPVHPQLHIALELARRSVKDEVDPAHDGDIRGGLLA